MCCIRFNRCKKRRNDIVLDNSHIQRIALRGPGCINGTGQCEGVQGTGCICCGRVLGTGSRHCPEVLGTGGRRRQDHCCEYCCEWLLETLATPTTVPR